MTKAFTNGLGDGVTLHAPGGTEQLEILEVRYEHVPGEPFREPANMSGRLRFLLDSLSPRTSRTVDVVGHVASHARVSSVWRTFTHLGMIVVISRDLRRV